MAPVFFSTQNMPGTSISNLGVNYFHFEMSRIPNIVYNIQEASLPGIRHLEQDQPTTLGIPVKRPIGAYKFDSFTLSFLVDENMQNWFEIYRWMRGLGNIDDDCTYNQYNNKFENMTTLGTLHITKGTYKDNIKVKFFNMFPTALSGLKFTSTANSYQPQYASVTFEYTYYSFEPDPGSPPTG